MAMFSRGLIKSAFGLVIALSAVLLMIYSETLSSRLRLNNKYREARNQFMYVPKPVAKSPPPRAGVNDTRNNGTQNTITTQKSPRPVAQAPTKVVHAAPAKTTSQSYRTWHKPKGRMETNKINDDYNICPRKVPFVGPFNYTQKAQNPCWLDEVGVFRCVPYFYIVGFSKCGTTDLMHKICHHKDVLRTSAKEKHWFDYRRYFDNSKFIQNYTDMFDKAAQHIKERLKTTEFNGKVAGDATPCYVWGSLNWPCYEGNEDLSEPRYTIADQIYRLNPKSKIIILLREPASRLYSRILTWISEPLHPVYINATPEKFHTFIEQRIAMYKECFQKWTIRHCAYDGTMYKKAVLRLMESAYSVYVKDWLKVFPREQLLIIRFEDYIINTRQTLAQVFSFLELAPLSDHEMQVITELQPANRGRYYHIGQMLNKTRDVLQLFYRPFNEELSQLLNDSRFNWNYTNLQITQEESLSREN